MNLATGGWVPSLPYGATVNGALVNVATFNFGDQSFERQLHSVTINSGGLLYVNQQSEETDAGLGPNANLYPNPGTLVLPTDDCGATVTINTGGSFVIGTAGPQSGFKAEVQFLSGSVLDINGGGLVVNHGSTLRMRAGSALYISGNLWAINTGHIIIELGARLVIRPDAHVHLSHDASRLTLRGEFAIASGATFQPTGNGYVYFDLPNQTAAHGHNNVLMTDVTSRFVLHGPDPTHRMAVMAPGKHLTPTYWLGFEFIIENGTVEMGEGATIDCAHAYVTLANAAFVGTRNAALAGYNTVLVRNYARENLHDCQFSGAVTGLIADLGTTTNVPTYTNLTFSNVKMGLQTYGSGLNLVGCTFDNSTAVDPAAVAALNPAADTTYIGWQAHNLTFASTATRLVSKKFNFIGVELSSPTHAPCC